MARSLAGLAIALCLAAAATASVFPDVRAVGASASATPATAAQVRAGFLTIQSAFSNITLLKDGLGQIFTPDGQWCALVGSPCQNTAANISAFGQGFVHGFNLVSAISKFSGLSVNNGYGSFDYVKTFTCQASCGARTCLVPGKSGFEVDAATGKIIFLHDYVDANDWATLCVNNCECTN